MPNRSRIYVGGLSRRTGTRTLEKIFQRYGHIRDLDLKNEYAFIVPFTQEYDDARDASDAIDDMDRQRVDGSKIIVELAGSRKDRSTSSRDTCYNCGKTGHWYFSLRASECSAGDWRGKCYKCGQTGHEKRDCKASRSRSRSRSKTPAKEPEKPVEKSGSQTPERREEYD